MNQPFFSLKFNGLRALGFCMSALLVLLTSSSLSLAKTGQYQCFAEPKSQRLLYQWVAAGAPASFKPKGSRYVDSYTSVDVLVDVRERFETLKQPEIQLKKALRIPLYSLRTKHYLKDKRVILVGTGFDDFLLEQEITKLQKLGFRSLKIMRFGIAAFLDTDQLKKSPRTSLKIRTASAQEVIGGHLGHEQDFLFINLDESNDVFNILGVESIDLPFNDNKEFYKKMFLLANEKFDVNNHIRLILVHDDPSVYRVISQSKYMFDMSGLFFVEGGNSALSDLQKDLAKTAILSQKIKRQCG